MGLQQLNRILPLLNELSKSDMNDAQLATLRQHLQQSGASFPMEQQQAAANLANTQTRTAGEQQQNDFAPQIMQSKSDEADLSGLGSFLHGAAFAGPQGELNPAIMALLQKRGMLPPPDPNAAMSMMASRYGFKTPIDPKLMASLKSKQSPTPH